MMIRTRTFVFAVIVLTLLGTLSALAQGSKWTREEWNDYQEVLEGATPAEIAAGFDAFLQKHPDSALRTLFQDERVNALFKSQNFDGVLKAVDEFLSIDKDIFLAAGYTEVNYPLTIYAQHRTHTFVIRQMLGSGALTDEQMAGGVKHSRAGIESLPEIKKLQAQAGATPEQIAQAAEADELMYHQVLATLTWRQKAYEEAIPELNFLMEKFPTEANLPLQLGYSYLNRGNPDTLKGIWYLARAVSMDHPQADSARRTVLGRIVRHTGVAPRCMQEDIDAVYTTAGQQMHPPAGWGLVSSEQINAARQGITYAGLFEELAAGTEDAHIAWLAACGIPFGLGDDGSPTYEAVLLSFEEIEVAVEATEAADGEEAEAEAAAADTAEEPEMQKAVVLRVAATQPAVDAKVANMEVVVVGFTNIAKLREEAAANQTIKIGGTIASFTNGPFVLRLKEGKVGFLAAVFDEQKR